MVRQGLYYSSPLTDWVSAIQVKQLRQTVVAASMSKRIEKPWLVHMSIENAEQDRCVDLFSRPDGSHGFEEFRRDPEDLGGWTPVHYFADAAYDTARAALIAALELVPWLQEAVDRNTSARAVLLQSSR